MHISTLTLKYILFGFNFLCALLGFILISFGIWLVNSIEDIQTEQDENLAAVSTILLGTVVVIVSLFGSVATVMQSKRMLISYAVILVVLLIIQLVLLSISYTAASGSLSEGLQQGFDELWDKAEHYNGTLSFYEEWLQCCGKNSAEDYFLLDKIPPASCCKERDCTNVLNLYVSGCEQKFKEYISAKTSSFNTISWWLIVVEFLGSVFACILVDRLRNHRDRIRFYS